MGKVATSYSPIVLYSMRDYPKPYIASRWRQHYYRHILEEENTETPSSEVTWSRPHKEPVAHGGVQLQVPDSAWLPSPEHPMA